jgi:hypothetical protein
MKRLFIFAIGGTGSRVLKSLIMLSAAGVRPAGNEEYTIVPIIIDPHQANKDLLSTKTLLTEYRRIREKVYGDNKTVHDGFFATPIVTLHDIMSTENATNLEDSFIFDLSSVIGLRFRDYIGYSTMNEANKALTSLLFSEEELDKKMDIGFVGSPNKGSVVLNQFKDSDEFKAFANVFREGDRIFFISSIFGGTGAAGFPIMVQNIRHPEKMDVSNKGILQNSIIGALTVLPYFNIKKEGDKDEIQRSHFIVKTQSALQYYNDTLTGVNCNTLNSIFYLGDAELSAPYENDPGEGGQHNPAHFIEFIGALAPLKFASMNDAELRIDSHDRANAFEYVLNEATGNVNFKALGGETRQLVYNSLVKFHMLYLYLNNGIKKSLGEGFTADEPKIKSDFFNTIFYDELINFMSDGYRQWLGEMSINNRRLLLFDILSKPRPNQEPLFEFRENMAESIVGIPTQKPWYGKHKSLDYRDFSMEMTHLNHNENYSGRSAEYKLFDLFYKAAGNIIDEKFEKII